VLNEVLAALAAGQSVSAVKGTGEQQRFVSSAGEGMRGRPRCEAVSLFSTGLFSLVFALTTAVGSAVVLYIGVRHVQAGRLTLGDLVP